MPTAAIPIVVIAAAFVVQLLVQRLVTNRFEYRCARCEERFSLSPLAAVVAPHRLAGTKFVKCPSCGTRSWASPVAKAR